MLGDLGEKSEGTQEAKDELIQKIYYDRGYQYCIKQLHEILNLKNTRMITIHTYRVIQSDDGGEWVDLKPIFEK